VLQSEDILQSVALEAFRDLPRFEPRAPGSLRAFLHKLVINKIRDRADFHSAKKRGAALSLETSMLGDVGMGDSDHGEGPRFYDSERYERLERALDRLPDDMRQAIVLRRFEGLSSREAADAMGKTDDAMRKLYSRALARLTLLVSGPDERSNG
ncbi:MAG: sigma-70 family RNA polymerase sigma factor, partial [Planctomycetes bacterium]|nr:sigma-70 family RNA polymerase sigma factor [Planctomycetota bacterium]